MLLAGCSSRFMQRTQSGLKSLSFEISIRKFVAQVGKKN